MDTAAITLVTNSGVIISPSLLLETTSTVRDQITYLQLLTSYNDH